MLGGTIWRIVKVDSIDVKPLFAISHALTIGRMGRRISYMLWIITTRRRDT